MTEPYETTDKELDALGEDALRLAAALRVARLFLDDDTLHCVVGPPNCQLTVGYIVDGALAQHEQVNARRTS